MSLNALRSYMATTSTPFRIEKKGFNLALSGATPPPKSTSLFGKDTTKLM